MENEPKKLSSERLLMFNNPGQCSAKMKKQIDKPPTLPGTGRQDDILDSQVFQKPMRLTETTNGKVQCFPETLKEINKIGKTLNIVSVVGTLRTGKSFLLNTLAGIKPGDPGFEMGHTPTAVTKGIWVMCRQHPTQKDQVLVLLDTEGIDDPKKVHISDDQSLFILATLLSSTMVYNTGGNFDRIAIDKFKFLTKIKESVKVAGTEEDDSILDFFFPTFILTLRDFTLELKTTPDVFLENNLNLENGTTDSIRNFNTPRRLIRRYFKTRRCFVFRKPVKRDQLSNLRSIPEEKLKDAFQVTLNQFRDYVYTREPKALKSGKGINGRMLVSLLVTYVNSINDHDSPCILQAIEHMAEAENMRAIRNASKEYEEKMKKMISQHSTPDDTGLATFHKESMKSAMVILQKEAVFDDISIFEKQVLTVFEQNLNSFKATVDKNSKSLCQEKLRSLDLRIRKKINNRTYCHPSGYDEYIADIDWIIKQYKKNEPYLGSKARETLQNYLDNKEEEEESVYQMVLKSQEGNQSSIPQRFRRGSVIYEDYTQKETERNLKEDETLMKDVKDSLMVVQAYGLKSIGEQYREMLTLKIQESERIAQELSPNDPYYNKLKQETEYWRKLLEKASIDLEAVENDKSPLQERYPPDGEDQEYERRNREHVPKLQQDQRSVDKKSTTDQLGGKTVRKPNGKRSCKIQ